MNRRFLIEGLDRLGKDLLIRGIMDRLGYHLVVHYQKPLRLECDILQNYGISPEEAFQRASFRAMFGLLESGIPLILNRSHLGEWVYGQHRGYDPSYVFELEQQHRGAISDNITAILLVEDFYVSRHFKDDGLSLEAKSKRPLYQERFLEAFKRSAISDKRVITVTSKEDGGFRPASVILEEALR